MKTKYKRPFASTLLAVIGLSGIFSVLAQNGTWITKEPMPEPRHNTAGAVIAGQLFAIGGALENGAAQAPQIYDPVLNTWSFGAPASIARAAAAVAVLDGKIYVAGGWINSDSSASTGALEIYDPAIDSWTSGAPMPTPRGQTAVAAIAGRMYVTGGRAGWGNQFGTLEIYDPVANAWSTGAPLPITVETPGFAAIGAKLYVVGGFNFANYLTTGALQIYDPNTDVWSLGAPMPTPRSGAMVGVINGKLIAAGGHDGGGHVATVEVYDSASDSWTSGTPVPVTVLGGAAGVIGSQLFIAGGYGYPDPFPLSGTLYVLTMNTPPVAQCRNVTVSAGANCDAEASVENGSYDRDSGDSITITQTPAGSYPVGTTAVTLTVRDSQGASSSCVGIVTVVDSAAPAIACPPNMSVGCSPDKLMPVSFSVTASDACDASPSVVCSPASGAGFPVGTTTVNCVATDATGNQSQCSFTVTRAALSFSGFVSPIGGADASGGNFANPLRTFKMGSTIPVKFTASCGGSPMLAGIHTLQAIKFSDSTTAGTPIDASPQDSATSGNQFRLSDSEWQFNIDTKATGMSTGIWQLIATLSDGSQHTVWIQLK